MHYLVAPLALPTSVISLLLILCPALGFRRLPSVDYLPQLPCCLACHWMWPLTDPGRVLEGDSTRR